MSTPSLKVVVAITSPIAFHALKNQSILQTCIQTSSEFALQYGANAHIAVAGTKEDLLHINNFDCEKIYCDPNSAADFAHALKMAQPTDLVMIHDSQRALTKTAQFERVLSALTSDCDAVRPVSGFTETLKVVNAELFIEGTIDRNSMKKIATPELIRYSAINFNGSASTWFVPLQTDARITTVDADPESARINSEKEIELMKYLVDWIQ